MCKGFQSYNWKLSSVSDRLFRLGDRGGMVGQHLGEEGSDDDGLGILENKHG